MINEYEDVLKTGETISGDVQNVLQHRFASGGDAMRRLDIGLDYSPESGAAKRAKQRGKFVLNQRELHELLMASDNATQEVSVLLDGITQE